MLAAYDKTQSFAEEIDEVLHEIRTVLIDKNRKYGDSALTPIRIFSKAPADEQLRIRLDDKLKRIANQQSDDDEDAELDTLGYIILLKIAKNRKKNVSH